MKFSKTGQEKGDLSIHVLLISFVFAIVVLFMKRHFTRLRYSAFVDDECFKYAFHEKLFSLKTGDLLKEVQFI
jgi:hypothetical protein